MCNEINRFSWAVHAFSRNETCTPSKRDLFSGVSSIPCINIFQDSPFSIHNLYHFGIIKRCISVFIQRAHNLSAQFYGSQSKIYFSNAHISRDCLSIISSVNTSF